MHRIFYRPISLTFFLLQTTKYHVTVRQHAYVQSKSVDIDLHEALNPYLIESTALWHLMTKTHLLTI